MRHIALMSVNRPTGQWLLSRQVQDIIEWKCIPFYIQGLGDSSMDAHDGNPAKTVPTDQCTLSPQEGEIIMKTIKRVVKGRQGHSWTVSFTVDNDSQDFIFEERVLAPLEPLKYDPSAGFVDCGHFLMQCVHPFISMDILMDVAHNMMFPESVDRIEEVRTKYTDFLEAALKASPALWVHMEEDCKGVACKSRERHIQTQDQYYEAPQQTW
ncbi:hypothetical protein EDB85DRAFT_1893732 [Lactarius pseudohatsudake]|nr:hypothetical protein EDB85DRAFT_1893732 [Lactarius pseudohatsudake]